MNRKNIFTALCAVTIGIILLFEGENLSIGVRRGLSLCSKSIIPSLFPFMALSVFICKSAAADFISLLFYPIIKIFRLPEKCGGILLAAAIGGYPAGAKCINDAVCDGIISKSDGERMLTFCVNSGPPFLISTVGGIILGSKKAGLLILVSQLFSCIITAFLTSLGKKSNRFISLRLKNTVQKSTSLCIVESVTAAAESCFRMCAFIVISCGVLEILKQGYFFSHIVHSSEVTAVFSGIFEVSAGCIACKDISGNAAIIIAGGITAFSGISVMLQVAAVTEESKISLIPFILSRPINAIFSSAILWLLISCSNPSTTVFSVYGSNVEAVFSESAPVAVSLLCMAALFLLSLVPPKSESESPLLGIWQKIRRKSTNLF